MALKPIVNAVKLFQANLSGKVTAEETDRSHRALTWLMFGLVKVSEEFLECYPNTPALYDSRVIYKPEIDTEEWQDIPTTLERGFGDCEDLAIYRCADLRYFEGIHALPYVTWRTTPRGNTILHALVRYPNGLVEDPSRALGMNGLPIVRRPIFIDLDPM